MPQCGRTNRHKFNDTDTQKLLNLLILIPKLSILNALFYLPKLPAWAGISQSVKRLATRWTVRGSNLGEGEIFLACSDRSWGPPSLLYNGYRVFLGGRKRPGRDADPSPPSSAEI
jgi:hypothetical protein